MAHQVYDLDVPPNAGGLVQKNGIRRGMFELAVQVAGFMMALSEMTMVAEATRKAIGAMAKRLLFSVPGVQEADDAQQHDEPDEGSASLRLRRLS